METIVVTGAAGAVGSRVCRTLAETDGVDVVVALDRRDASPRHRRIVAHRVDLTTDDLKPLFEGATAVVHLASAFDASRDGVDISDTELETARRVLDAAAATGVQRLVVLSSAMVYGAWPDNPVPITEDIAPQPNPDFSFAVTKAEVERLAGRWAEEHPGTEVAVLRPTTALAEGAMSWVARALRAAALIDAGQGDPAVQFLHLDDLASAVVLAARGGLVGVYNVAPDGSIDGETCRDLSGRLPRLRISEQVADRLARVGWRHGAPTPPGLTPYTIHPWVVANDRLKAAGWNPEYTNEVAYVEGTRPRPWATMNAKRRQQLALGGAGLLGAIVGLMAISLVRRLRRR
jgi:nucleoside-diphosphate-sugar epimerase